MLSVPVSFTSGGTLQLRFLHWDGGLLQSSALRLRLYSFPIGCRSASVLRFVGFYTKQCGGGIYEVKPLGDSSVTGMGGHIQFSGIVTGGVRHKGIRDFLTKTYRNSGLSHPLAAEHIQAERTAETVYPVLFLGKSEAHPRAGICEPAVAAVQGIGSVGNIQYIIECIPLLRSVLLPGVQAVMPVTSRVIQIMCINLCRMI